MPSATAFERIRGPQARGRRDVLGDLFIALQRTADRLMQGMEDALKQSGCTPVQYWVLRSLRQAGSAGMPSNQIVRDMTTHDPDMTRLLDKLEERDVVERWRDKDDRRVYRVKLTRHGARVFRDISKRVTETNKKQFSTIDKRKIEALTKMLGSINEAPIPICNRAKAKNNGSMNGRVVVRPMNGR